MNPKVAVVLTSYNNADSIHICINSIITQEYEPLLLIIADDGSTDDTVKQLRYLLKDQTNAKILALEHGERGIARKKAIDLASEKKYDYLLFIDSDMHLEPELITDCQEYMEKNPKTGALVIPESPYSSYTNFATRVKIFERKIINNAGTNINGNSIEAARFWRQKSYIQSGGINPSQISFEETQPTIRYMSAGGIITRIEKTSLHHDEKFVTFKNLFEKKRYYFGAMEKTISTEKKGLRSALKRWYFFRSVLYRPSNLFRAIQHPILALGMLYMYIILTFIGGTTLIVKLGRKKKHK